LEAASRGACASWWIGGGLASRWRGSVSQRRSCSANRPKCERSRGHVVSVLTVAEDALISSASPRARSRVSPLAAQFPAGANPFEPYDDAYQTDADACCRGIYQEIDQPCMSTGDPQLCNFDCAAEARQSNCNSPRPIWIPGAECYADRQKDCEML
jgi:hypothetical protein